MELNREIVKDSLLKELEKLKKYNGVYSYYHKYNPIEFEKLVDEICDLSSNRIIPYSENDTYVLRKRLGILDNGKTQTLEEIGNAIGVSGSRVGQILAKFKRRLYYRLTRVAYAVDDRTKMSSLSIINEYRNAPLLKFELDKEDGIYKAGISTLYDLFTYGYLEIKNMGVSFQFIDQLNKVMDNFGLKYIDELSDEEKRIIVSNSSKEMIDNSSVSWISGLDESIINNLTAKHKKPTIADLKNYVENGGKVNAESIGYALGIGIDIREKTKVNINTEDVIPVKELLEKSIDRLDMSVRLFNSLNNAGIDTVYKIVHLRIRDIKKKRTLGPKSKQELITIIHELGLFFADEIPTMKMYAEEVSTQLDSYDREQQLLEKYRGLSSEKEELEAKSRELDYELSSVMKQLNSIGISEEIINGQSRKKDRKTFRKN